MSANGFSVDHLMNIDGFAPLHEPMAALRHRRLFFVGGIPKSGTTWLQLLLDAHPQISCRGEGHFCDSLDTLLRDALVQHNSIIQRKNADIAPAGAAFAEFTPAHLRYLLAAAIALLITDGAGDATIIGEKTPDNVFAFPRLHELFPAARFVVIMRDGRDCVTSTWFHNLRVDPDGARRRFPCFAEFVDVAAQAWAAGIETGWRFMDEHPHSCMSVTYESLVRAPDATVASLLEFLGADTDAAVVRQCVDAAAFPRLAGGRQAGDEERRSFFRRGVIGDWRNQFDAAALDAFEKRAGAVLRRCGYADATPTVARHRPALHAAR